jgi:hypothetical protein
MSLERKMRRRRRQLRGVSHGAQKMARAMVTEWVRQTGTAQRLDASEADTVDAVLELIDEHLCTIVVDEPDADGNFRFDIQPDYERVPWLRFDQ